MSFLKRVCLAVVLADRKLMVRELAHKVLTCKLLGESIVVGHGVSKRIEDGREPPALQAGHPRSGRKADLGLACPQGVDW
jgi:hypothetical protein